MDTGEKFLIGGSAALGVVALLFPRRSMAYSMEPTAEDAGPPVGPEAAASATGAGRSADQEAAKATAAGDVSKLDAKTRAKVCAQAAKDFKAAGKNPDYLAAKQALASGSTIQNLTEAQKAAIKKFLALAGRVRRCSPGKLAKKGTKGKASKDVAKQAASIAKKLKGKGGKGLLDKAKVMIPGGGGGMMDKAKDLFGGKKGKDDGAAQPDEQQAPDSSAETPDAGASAEPASEGADASAPNVEGWVGWGYTDSFEMGEHIEY